MADSSDTPMQAHQPGAGLADMTGSEVVPVRDADVGRSREAMRRNRFVRLTAGLWVLVLIAWWRALSMGGGSFLPLPSIDPFLLTIILFFALLIGMTLGQQYFSGRSPHQVYRPEQIETRLSDVVGIDSVKDDVVRSLNLFLAHKTFSTEMGGTPRRGLLFEGAPGTGKTHLARAMAKEAGVPFLFVSATSFQSMWFGATAKKIRAYFKALRKAARKEGGAIGFMEEIDAIAMSRGGVSTGMTVHQAGPVRSAFTSEGTGGVVNELLVQMQSFDALTGWQRLGGWFVDRANLLLPADRQLQRPSLLPANVLLIAATNRADSLDPALLRPGRFDRRMTFELPGKAGRRQLIDHFLVTKAHAAELDGDELRDALAAITQGYSPVMIEHLFDEALVSAVRGGRRAMSWADVEHARMIETVGIGAPVDYTPHERVLIATHEAGHATLAWLVAPQRRLEILTIIKRGGALGLLAHGDREDVYTQSRSDLRALVQIAFAGQCAEEVFFGEVSSGPGGDLVAATRYAANMIGVYGMEDTLLSYQAIESSQFSDTNIVGRMMADPQGRAQLEALLQELKAESRTLLQRNRHLVEALRDALLEREELIGSEITDVLQDAATRDRVIDLTAPAPAGSTRRIDAGRH
ncbi:MAG: ATPase central domain protein [Frankiales bacterium]|nr:ATPase central domain protein [Frankiales bacterium]